MKKSDFIALILGTVSGVLFALGMCMALLPEWNAFTQGILLGTIGLILGIINFIIWRKMENKKFPKLCIRTVLLTLYAIISILVIGLGMCLCLVWENIILGTVIGLIGIVMLISLIPMTKGIK